MLYPLPTLTFSFFPYYWIKQSTLATWKKNLRDAGALVSTFGLAAFTSAIAGGNGFSTGILSAVLGGIFTNIASDLTTPLMERVSGILSKKHPGELNHDLQKLLVQAIQDALRNTATLYKEKATDNKEQKEVLSFLRELSDSIPLLLSPQSSNQVSNRELQQYLAVVDDTGYDQLLIRLQAGYLKEHFSEEFNQFFREVFPVQLQVCYAQLLKDKSHQPAWIAYQKMLLEETRTGISEILERQDKLEKGISELRSQKWLEKVSRLTPRKTASLKELLAEMNRPQALEISFTEALDQRLSETTKELNAIKTLLQETHRSVKKTEENITIIRKRLIGYVLAATALIIVLAIGLYTFWYRQQNQPFDLRVIVHGPKGLDDRVLKNTGTLTLSYPGKQESATLNEKGEALFRQLPGNTAHQPVRIHLGDLNGLPYQSVCDTCPLNINQDKLIYIAVKRTGLDSLRGQVTDNGYPVKDALITVQGLTTNSDENGKFLLIIPENKQELRQQVLVTKQGYHYWNNWVNSPDWIPVHLEK